MTTIIQCYPWWQGGQQVEGVVVVHKDGIPIESSMEKTLTVEVNTDTVMAGPRGVHVLFRVSQCPEKAPNYHNLHMDGWIVLLA